MMRLCGGVHITIRRLTSRTRGTRGIDDQLMDALIAAIDCK